jgi:hypothetical protein
MRPHLLAVLALLAAATPAVAAPRLHGIPAHVRSGQELQIAWTGLGPEADEAELELSLAGGRWVRISPELEAHEGGFTWRVPAGLAGPARLRLKYGGEGFEAEGETSTPFVLEAGAATATRSDDPALDDWWSLGRLGGELPFPQVSGAASLHRAAQVWALAPEPRPMARFVVAAADRFALREDVRRRSVPCPCHGELQRIHPLRI